MNGFTLFSGIGGVEAGMVEAGVKPVLGVEGDPSDWDLSRSFAGIHRSNGWNHTKLMSVEAFTAAFQPGLPDRPFLGHISLVCADFSAAQSGKGRHDNMDMARCAMDAVKKSLPQYLSLEQVPGFKESNESDFVIRFLDALGYKIQGKICNVGGDSGQSRSRFIITASRSGKYWSIPADRSLTWFEVLEPLLPSLEPIEPTDRQKEAVRAYLRQNPHHGRSPLWVQRVTCGKDPAVRGPDKAAPCTVKSWFRDGNGAGRSKVASIRIGSTWLNVSLQGWAKICGFPDWFEYPNLPEISGAGFGYAVPPMWYARLVREISKSGKV